MIHLDPALFQSALFVLFTVPVCAPISDYTSSPRKPGSAKWNIVRGWLDISWKKPSIVSASKPASNLQVDSHQIRTSLIIGNHKHVLRHAFRAVYQRFVGIKVFPLGSWFAFEKFFGIYLPIDRIDALQRYRRVFFRSIVYNYVKLIIVRYTKLYLIS